MVTSNVTETRAITQADVLYVAQQLSNDLMAFSQAYRKQLAAEEAFELFGSYSNFMINSVILRLGFSICDPQQDNFVYHELRYHILYGGELRSLNPQGVAMGKGGARIDPVSVPRSAIFVPWVTWSPRMLELPVHEQELIVQGTKWDIPSRGSTFQARYEGGTWTRTGLYSRGGIGADGETYVT